jgi:methionyl aminopeptidase
LPHGGALYTITGFRLEPTEPMPIKLKTPAEIEHMRVAGRLAASVLEMIEPHVVPGVTTGDLDRLCHEYIVGELRAIPAPLNYTNSPSTPPFPKSICTSVNHVVCHGIPSEKKRLKAGDMLNIDITVIKNGYHGDTSKMFFVGEPSVLAQRLAQVTRECLFLGIGVVKPGARLGDIGAVIQAHAEANRFSVVREFCGHGIGEVFHDEPQVLHYGRAGTGVELKAGMTFTIEPMVNAGSRHVKMLPDHWTVVTKDHKLSAQWEHTILVTETGAEILTLRTGESPP